MKSANTQYKNMAATLVFTIVLLALLYINVSDPVFRLRLLCVTGGFGLIVSIVFGVRGAWYAMDDRMAGHDPLKLKSIKGMIIMACVAAYFASATIVNLRVGRQKGGFPGKAYLAIAAIQCTLAIFGLVMLLGFIAMFRGAKRGGEKRNGPSNG